MRQETDIRGQQAGGIAVVGAGGRFVGHKGVNEKRGNLTGKLLGASGRRVMLHRLLGARPLTEIVHLMAHYRYGTSSGPSVIETHWHRWLPPRTEMEGIAAASLRATDRTWAVAALFPADPSTR